MGRPPLGEHRRAYQRTARFARADRDLLLAVLEQVRAAEAAAGVPEKSRTSESALIVAMVAYCCRSPVAIAALLTVAATAAPAE
jgi:hypothetical protein